MKLYSICLLQVILVSSFSLYSISYSQDEFIKREFDLISQKWELEESNKKQREIYEMKLKNLKIEREVLIKGIAKFSNKLLAHYPRLCNNIGILDLTFWPGPGTTSPLAYIYDEICKSRRFFYQRHPLLFGSLAFLAGGFAVKVLTDPQFPAIQHKAFEEVLFETV